MKDASALPAGKRGCLLCGCVRLRPRPEENPNRSSRLFGRTTQKTVVPQAGKPLWQHMKEPASNELVRCQSHDRVLARSATGPEQANPPLPIAAKEALGRKGTAMNIAGEVAQGGNAFADVLELHIPLLLCPENPELCRGERRIDLRMQILEGCPKAAPEPRRKRRVMHKKGSLVRVNKRGRLPIKSQRRNDAVDVGMVLHLASPGVEDRSESAGSCLVLGGDDIGERSGAFAKNEIVELFRKGEAKRPQFGRHRKSHHEVGHREEASLLLGGPELLIESSALRAVTMIATVIGEVMMLTIPALVEPPAEFGSSARENTLHCLVMSSAKRGAMLAVIARPMLRQNIGERERHGELG